MSVSSDDTPFTRPDALPIKQLPKEVVNRIAAGEVIQRPANAIKELLENSLDAGSTQIQVTVRNGGLKMLQVQDNGCGIRTEDLPILCERFTTSKLREFSDLNSLLTFGFRGEALASLSHVSLLTVTTRTADQPCAYRMTYRDGRPSVEQATACAGNPGTTILAEDLFYNAPLRKQALRNAREEFARVAETVSQYAIHYAPKCGFHLRSLTTGSVTGGCDLRTSAGWSRMDAIRVVVSSTVAEHLVAVNSCQAGPSEATTLAIERLGLRFEGLLTNPSQITSGPSPALKLNLFINNRMVECNAIRRALESSYSTVLARGMQSASAVTNFRRASGRSAGSMLFVYMNLQLPPESLDVNVHPTKAEVHFLHEDQIIAGIQDAVEHSLLACAQVRSFLTKPLPLSDLSNARDTRSVAQEIQHTRVTSSPLSRPQEKVRVDSREQRLERFMVTHSASTRNLTSMEKRSVGLQMLEHERDRSPNLAEDGEDADTIPFDNSRISVIPPDFSDSSLCSASYGTAATPNDESRVKSTVKPESDHTPSNVSTTTPVKLLTASSTLATSPTVTPIRRRTVRLDSVLSMQRTILEQADEQAKRILRSCTMVGLIDRTRCLVQHSTDLVLIRLQPLSKALFYQMLVRNFANHGELVLSESAPLYTLFELGQSTCTTVQRSHTPSVFAHDCTDRLMRNAAMLWDYFSLKLEVHEETHEPVLTALPLLLDKYIPDLDKLPILVVRLATEVDWTNEVACIQGVCDVLADFYSLSASVCSEDVSPCLETTDDVARDTHKCSSSKSHGWIAEHVVWPAIVSLLIPPRGLLFEEMASSQSSANETPEENNTCAFFRLARLSDLYKVFERC